MPEKIVSNMDRAALETFYAQTIQLCYEAEDAMENENADRQTILENLIDEIRSL